MLSFVLQYAPKEWEEVAEYTESFILFDLGQHSQEYEEIASLFLSASLKIKSIKRVQQPFQYGRFKLRQEMLRTHTVVRIITLMFVIIYDLPVIYSPINCLQKKKTAISLNELRKKLIVL